MHAAKMKAVMVDPGFLNVIGAQPVIPQNKAAASAQISGSVPLIKICMMQNFTSAYELNYALSAGTIFPQLCKPFCGKRGRSR